MPNHSRKMRIFSAVALYPQFLIWLSGFVWSILFLMSTLVSYNDLRLITIGSIIVCISFCFLIFGFELNYRFIKIILIIINAIAVSLILYFVLTHPYSFDDFGGKIFFYPAFLFLGFDIFLAISLFFIPFDLIINYVMTMQKYF
jgi:hypothetical protein